MSSFAKASKVNQKVHRERHQPEHRRHLGFLEKKKDYQQRAQDQDRKKKILNKLKKKALNKNPDEYRFHMINSKMINDEHKEIRKPKEHTSDQIRLMKTRDIKYIIMKRTVEKKQIEKLQSRLHLIDKGNNIQNSHVFFVDTEDEVKNFDVVKRLDTHPDLLNRRYNRPRLSDLGKFDLPDFDEDVSQRMRNQQNKIYTELKRRINRENELAIIQRKLEIERYLHTKKETKPVQIKPATEQSAPVYKWKQQRKR